MEQATAVSEAVEPLDRIDLERTSSLLRDMVLSLICHVRNMPHLEGGPRQSLDQLALRLRRTTDPDEVQGLFDELSDVCSDVGAITDTFIEKALRERHTDLKRIIAALTASMKAISSTNSSLGAKLVQEAARIEEALDEDDPGAAGQKLLDVSRSLLQATTQVKAEVESAKTQMQDASGRIKELEDQLEQTRQESLRDGLTRLYNRRAFNEMLSKTFSGVGVKSPCSLIMVDIDHFKKVNDLHGHLIGDALLMKVARILDGATDSHSFVARYGGEEFAIIVGNVTLTKATELAEEIRTRVRAGRWSYRRENEQRTLSATISLGVAQFRGNDTPDTVIERADKALYLAKGSGRDQVRTELGIEETG